MVIKSNRNKLLLAYLLILFFVVNSFPIFWGLSTSFKPLQEISAYPPKWLPEAPTLQNYYNTLAQSPMLHYFKDTFIVTVGTIILTLILGVPGGYAACRFNFRGKDTLMFILLSTMMIPGAVIMVPLYMMASKLGMINSYSLLILVYSAWRVPMVIWIMKGFFETLPRALEESAEIDGCTPFQAFWKVVLPVSGPGMAASTVILAVYVWNETILALTLTTDIRVITVGLYDYMAGFGIEWGQMMAAIMCALIPMLVLFFVLQKSFIQGLTSGAIKG